MKKKIPPTWNTRLVWLLLLVLAFIDASWILIRGMSLAREALALIFLPILGMLVLAWFYMEMRPDRRLATLAHMTAATLGFMSATCVLSYLVITLRFPLIDANLAAADRALGFDWPAMYAWIAARPVLHVAMRLVYMGLVPQIFVMQIVFNFRGQIKRAWELLWLFVFTCLGCVVLSGIWPATGAFSYYHVERSEPYLREFASLYDGTMKAIGSKGGFQGLVTFPSLHMALAVIFPYAARGVPILFPLLLVLNILIMITTPAIGGHYFADLWGGAILALASIWLVRQNFMAKLLAATELPKTKEPPPRAKKIRGRNR